MINPSIRLNASRVALEDTLERGLMAGVGDRAHRGGGRFEGSHTFRLWVGFIFVTDVDHETIHYRIGLPPFFARSIPWLYGGGDVSRELPW